MSPAAIRHPAARWPATGVRACAFPFIGIIGLIASTTTSRAADRFTPFSRAARQQAKKMEIIEKHFSWMLALLLASLLLTALQGCAKPTRYDAVPQGFQKQVVIPGLDGVRYRPLVDQEPFVREALEMNKRERAYRAANGLTGPLPPAAFLAISGGGDNGAFGAGLLNGWTARGDRPEFKLVTGISTGALTAPFAFLGPAYDAALTEVYTTITPKDILIRRNLLTALFSDALTDNAPLWQLVKKYVNRELLDAIAAEYETKGRLLLVGTTNLDASDGVIWNMTKIAASRDSRALDLFRRIMIASAAIPAAFPPVLIDVEANGRRYQEMHVDGGTVAQVFVYPPSFELKELAQAQGVDRERRLYIIYNGRLDPDWAQVDRRTLPIAMRAIGSLITTQGVGSLYRIYMVSQRDDVDYNLAFVPATFDLVKKEDFDNDYMRALYAVGLQMGKEGYPWAKVPPGYVAPKESAVQKISEQKLPRAKAGRVRPQ